MQPIQNLTVTNLRMMEFKIDGWKFQKYTDFFFHASNNTLKALFMKCPYLHLHKYKITIPSEATRTEQLRKR